MADRMVTTLIADDEPLARQRLSALLAEIPWIALVGEVADGMEAVRAIDELKPELIFLDVVMPGCTGIEVLSRITHRPSVVFTTAYDRYAVAAFEARALDYLLKPFGRRRLVAALDRIHESLGGETERRRRIDRRIERGRTALEPGAPLEWLFVRERGRVTPVNVQHVVRFEGSDDYVTIHTARAAAARDTQARGSRAMLPCRLRAHPSLAHREPRDGGELRHRGRCALHRRAARPHTHRA